MTYNEAVEEMRALAKGEYWTLKHETTPRGVEISGYIGNDHAWALPAATYREAIKNVKRRLGMTGSDPAPEDDLHVAPNPTPVRELDPAVIEETMTKDNEEYKRRGE